VSSEEERIKRLGNVGRRIKAFYVMLKLGSATISKIARHFQGVPMADVREVLDELVAQGELSKRRKASVGAGRPCFIYEIEKNWPHISA